VALAGPEVMPHNSDGTPRPTIYMEKVSRAIEATPKMSTRDVVAMVGGKNKYVSEALGLLVAEGYVVADIREGRGGGFVYTSVEPYRDDVSSHDMSKGTEEPRPNRGPTVPRPPGRGSDEPRPHAPTPTGQGRGSDRPQDLTSDEPRPGPTGEQFNDHTQSTPTDWMEL